MNTRILMTSSSLVLGAAGVVALFLPEVLLPAQSGMALLLVQVLGALYFAFAMMNWIAKDNAIGGIYARPVSLANFSHFFAGALLLAKHSFSNPFNASLLTATAVYVIYAACFYWLVFRATGLKSAAL